MEKHLNKHPVHVVEAGFWMPVGTPEELAAARQAFQQLDTMVIS
jgi:NDP-sugar pyrophosphorylase family protein